jgi:3-oxoacyl-(acyl-carrier-protein) synthase
MGVVAPNGRGLPEFERALRRGTSGIRFIESLAAYKFACQVGGLPQGIEEAQKSYFEPADLLAMTSHMVYAGMAGIDCWKDAGLELPGASSTPDWDTAIRIGTGGGGMEVMGRADAFRKIAQGDTRQLGGALVEQLTCSSASLALARWVGAGGQVTANSSACTTGTEAIVDAFFEVRSGRAKRVLAGGVEGGNTFSAPSVWAGFDSMRVLARGFNDRPAQASRPMSASAAGFVPAAGAGVLLLESLASARARGARIYAEIAGGHVNCGGQRGGGSITAPNPEGVIRCVREAVRMAGVAPREIDVINGHLTATMADPIEVRNWARALELSPAEFPLLQATKSLVGHALGGAGGIECVASVLQIYRDFVHGSVNCEDVHPELAPYRDTGGIPAVTMERETHWLAKASFGFGDVNAALVFKRWDS